MKSLIIVLVAVALASVASAKPLKVTSTTEEYDDDYEGAGSADGEPDPFATFDFYGELNGPRCDPVCTHIPMTNSESYYDVLKDPEMPQAVKDNARKELDALPKVVRDEIEQKIKNKEAKNKNKKPRVAYL